MFSIIIPFYNEKESLPHLLDQLTKECKELHVPYEIILIDDGSTDESKKVVESRKDPHVMMVSQRRRFGKGKALESGFNSSKGENIIFMDADLQNDPQDLSRFLKTLKEGYDFVNGYRKQRNDNVDKTLPSKIYNSLITTLFNVNLHDINCGYKAMRREILENIRLYGDNYRILPILAKHEGYRVTEIEVIHHPRQFGESKYGFMRIFYGLFDLITYFFLLRFVEKPLHFFGSIGTVLLALGSLILGYLGIARLFFGEMLYQRPVLFLGMLLVIVGVQVIATGFLGELIVYLSKRKTS
jgi:glycosyltransferase involved in cell wall biosynthesis